MIKIYISYLQSSLLASSVVSLLLMMQGCSSNIRINLNEKRVIARAMNQYKFATYAYYSMKKCGYSPLSQDPPERMLKNILDSLYGWENEYSIIYPNEKLDKERIKLLLEKIKKTKILRISILLNKRAFAKTLHHKGKGENFGEGFYLIKIKSKWHIIKAYEWAETY